jgi:gluconokinase
MIIIVMGVTGSGKSTIGAILAHALGWDFVDADSFHPAMNIDKMRRGMALSEDDRAPWLASLRKEILRWLAQDRSVVLACSALRARYRRLLMANPRRMRLVYLKGSADVLKARLSRRQHHFMSAALLASQLDILEEPSDAITIDIDQPIDTIVRQVRHALSSPVSS